MSQNFRDIERFHSLHRNAISQAKPNVTDLRLVGSAHPKTLRSGDHATQGEWKSSVLVLIP
jgi:hypothetical protein